MSKARKKHKKPKVEYEFLSVRVESYEVRVDASVNHHLLTRNLSWLPDDEPVNRFYTHLELKGTSFDPLGRSGDNYVITVYGEKNNSRPELTLKDLRTRDDDGNFQYRKYRGQEVPVYNVPHGVSVLDKVRGDNMWTTCLFVKPDFARDMLLLLYSGRPIFVSIHERKVGRQRWVQGITLQTTDPSEE